MVHKNRPRTATNIASIKSRSSESILGMARVLQLFVILSVLVGIQVLLRYYVVSDCPRALKYANGITGPACLAGQDTKVDPADMRSLEITIPRWMQQYGLCQADGGLLWYYYTTTSDPASNEPSQAAEALQWHQRYPDLVPVVVCTSDRLEFCRERSHVWWSAIMLVYHVDFTEIKNPFSILPVPVAVSSFSLYVARTILAFFAGSLYHEGPGQFRRTMAGYYPPGNEHSVVISEAVPNYASQMKRAVFCLCLPGWAPWSPRIYEAIAIGCIPVFYAKAPVQLPFPGRVDWRALSVVIPVGQEANTHTILKGVDIRAKRLAIDKAAPEVLWLKCPSRVLANVLAEIDLLHQNTSYQSYVTLG